MHCICICSVRRLRWDATSAVRDRACFDMAEAAEEVVVVLRHSSLPDTAAREQVKIFRET